MLRFLPWNPTLGGDKIMAQEIKSRISGMPRAAGQDTRSQVSVKRKRSASPGMSDTGRSAYTPPEETLPFELYGSKPQAPSPPTPLLSPADTAPSSSEDHLMSPEQTPENSQHLQEKQMTPKISSRANTQSLRQTIQTQLGLEILLKHKELRLIDQELGKCQIALEQLRRCTEIPFPVTQLSEKVSKGTGPALRQSYPGRLPRSPAPWGVTDGPYTRHYARWLLPDPDFDGGEVTLAGSAFVSRRRDFGVSTRRSFVDSEKPTSQSRARDTKSTALPSTPSIPKDKSGPLLVLRKSDNKMVKLVCLDCARQDFGSAQGFINHCRIGHVRSFASHDVAADACGQVVEVGPNGAVVGNEPSSVVAGSAVHPLIRSARYLKLAPLSTSSVPDLSHASAESAPMTTSAHSEPPQTTTAYAQDFKPSPLTPNLSALIRKRGLGLNMQELVSDAKAKTFVPESDDDDGSDVDVDTPLVDPYRGRHLQLAGMKHPAHQAMAPNSAGSRRNGGKSAAFGQQPRPHLRGGGILPGPAALELPAQHSSVGVDLEPSPTNESNQAPSLVDDDEDEYEGHSPTSSSVSGDDEGSEVDFQIEDDDIGGPSTLSPHTAYPDASKPQLASDDRRPSAFRRGLGGREEKHVSFVSVSPCQDSALPEHDKKRRKQRN